MHIYIEYFGRLSPSELNRVSRDFNLYVFDWQRLVSSKPLDLNSLERLMRANNSETKEYSQNKISKDFLLICIFSTMNYINIEYKLVHDTFRLMFSPKLGLTGATIDQSKCELMELKKIYDELKNSLLFDNLIHSTYFEKICFDKGGDDIEYIK